jgi:cell division protein FtsN
MSRVRGSTFLGLILGIIIGLAVALSVAMYVAKVPIPFVNTNTVPVSNSEQTAAEQQRNQNWNPNATLQPKNQGASAATNTANAPASGIKANTAGVPPGADSAGGITVPPPVEVTRTPPRVAIQTRPSNPENSDGNLSDDLTNNSTSIITPSQTLSAGGDRSNQGDLSPPPPPETFTYYVQTGAYRSSDDADSERARLSLIGMQASVSQVNQAGRPVYRVRIGPFQNRTAAGQIKDRLSENEIEASLVRVPR